jgi:hypothetical protein
MSQTKFPYKIHPGWPVQYIRGGDPNEPAGPAQIIKGNKFGVVDLLVFGEPKKIVRHIDDPELKANPNLVSMYGTWRFIPDFPLPPEIDPEPERPVAEVAPKRVVPTLTKEELDGEIVREMKAGARSTEVGPKYGKSYQYANNVYRAALAREEEQQLQTAGA